MTSRANTTVTITAPATVGTTIAAIIPSGIDLVAESEYGVTLTTMKPSLTNLLLLSWWNAFTWDHVNSRSDCLKLLTVSACVTTGAVITELDVCTCSVITRPAALFVVLLMATLYWEFVSLQGNSTDTVNMVCIVIAYLVHLLLLQYMLKMSWIVPINLARTVDVNCVRKYD